jgi:hypothetical protein
MMLYFVFSDVVGGPALASTAIGKTSLPPTACQRSAQARSAAIGGAAVLKLEKHPFRSIGAVGSAGFLMGALGMYIAAYLYGYSLYGYRKS